MYVFLSVPFFLCLEGVEQLKIAVMSGAWNISCLDRRENSAAVFLCMSAFCVSALAYIWLKLAECGNKVVYSEKVEALKIQHGKSRGVGNIAAVSVLGKRKKLHLSCGVPTALYLSAYLRGRQRELWEKSVHKSGFAYTRRSRKCGGLSVHIIFDKAVDRLYASVFGGA